MGGPGPSVHRHYHECTCLRRPASLLRDGPAQLSRRRDRRAHDKDTQIASIVLPSPRSDRPALLDRRRIDLRDKPAENPRRNSAAEEATLGRRTDDINALDRRLFVASLGIGRREWEAAGWEWAAAP